MSTVDRIREQLEKQDGLSAEAMEPLAIAYSVEVTQLNERLAACAGLLRKGLRSEALQQANIRPNLFDWSASLDFVEVDDWFEILQFFHIPVPPRINRQAVQQLNEALVEEQPLEDLLRQHRRLAIGKAPLSWRLKVLRAIAKLDTNNGVWVEDVELWEKARLKEIPTELSRATEAKDADACSRLAAELTQSPWRAVPPPVLVNEVTQRAAHFEYTAQCDELSEIGAALYDRFAEQNEAACRQQQAKWRALSGQLKKPVPDDLFQRVEPALLWLEELDQQQERDEAHSQNVANLVALLDQRGPLLDIQNAHSRTSSSGDLDFGLENRYRAVVTELSLTAKRRSMLSIASIAAVAFLALGAVGAWQWRSMRQARLESSVASLTQMLADGKLVEASQFVEQMKTKQSDLVDSPQIAALQADLMGRNNQEAERIAAFDSYLNLADQEQAAAIDLSQLLRAEELARSESEKEKVYRVRRRRQEYDRSVQADQFANLRESLSSVTAELDSLEKRPRQTLTVRDFESLLQQLDDLEKKWPLSGSEGLSLHSTVKKRATAMRDTIFQANLAARNEAEGLESIRGATSVSRLQQALESFCSVNPGATVTAEFKEALAERPHWTGIDKWNQFATLLMQYLQKPTPQHANEALTAFQTLKGELDMEVVLTRCPDLQDRLEAIARRQGILESLRQQLDQDFMSALVTLEGTSFSNKADGVGRVFTYLQQIDEQRSRLTSSSATAKNGVEVINGVDGTVGVLTFLGPLTIVDEPKKTFEKLIATSQLHEQELLAQWETQFLIQVNELIQQRSLDPIFKELLIAQMLKAGCEGSNYMKQTLGATSSMLALRKPRERSWYQIHRVDDNLEESLLAGLKTSCSASYRGVAAHQRQLKLLATTQLVFAGSLARGSDGKLEVCLPKADTADGGLVVARAAGANANSVRLESVGKVENGNVTLATSAPGQLAGRPVFLMSKN